MHLIAETPTRLRIGLGQQAANLFPGYFALVMATGIVSIAIYLLGLQSIAWAMLGINVVAYAVLWALTIVRLVNYFPRLWADLLNHAQAPGFLTIVAGTCVLGTQCVVIVGNTTVAAVLWILGLLLWLLLIYAVMVALSVREGKPALETGLNGAWLLLTVATQSVSVLGTLLAGEIAVNSTMLLLLTLGLFLVGCMLYILVISLIFYRFLFIPLDPKMLRPAYWINMGAVAITTLAGSMLILHADQWTFLQEILPFLKGFTLFFWSTGTWWIPLLIALGAWRHGVKRIPLVYDPQYWSMVFPLGMYTTCTVRLIEAMGWPFLLPLPYVFGYIALAAWVVTFIGLLRQIGRGLVTSSEPS